MSLTVSGDRGSILSRQLAVGTYFFAVASGFGSVDGDPAPARTLQRLGEELARRGRHDRFRRFCAKPKRVGRVLASAVSAVNAYVHGRSASHADYVTAACSLTAALVVENRAYLLHAGSTQGYLARGGALVVLTQREAFDGDAGLPVLVNALGMAPEMRLSISTFTLQKGDALVLRGAPDRLLIVRCEELAAASKPSSWRWNPKLVLRGAIAAGAFFAMLCIH